MTLEQLSAYGEELCKQHKGINWWIGDAARHAKHVLHLGDNYSQVFPPWVSPGLIQRCEAVASAYPKESDRNPDATWTVHMQHAKEPDRVAKVAAAVEAGRTSDEERKHAHGERTDGKARWLLCVDVSYFLHRFWFSGAGVEAASGVAAWVKRTVERLKEKGLTDVACCMDSSTNHRKELTQDWPDKYKDRPPRDPELANQLRLVHDLLKGQGFACVGLEGMEADDVMASYANQFDGRVTLLTQDKDCRQCLSEKCNMLLDVEWEQDEHSGEHLPKYKWLSAKQHTEATGIPPHQWVEYQCIMGDNTDGISGAVGIGAAGAAELIKSFGSAGAAIAAAKAEESRMQEVEAAIQSSKERIQAARDLIKTKPGESQVAAANAEIQAAKEVIQSAKSNPATISASQRKSLIAFETKLDVTRQLVTLRTDLELPTTTRV